MKKFLLVAAFAVCGIFSANAQETSFGVKAGANLAKFSGDLDEFDGRTSFYVGVVGEFMFTEKFGIQPEVVYSMQGVDDDLADVTLSYLNVPILAKYYIIEGLSVEVGPQFGFVIDDDDTEAESFDLSAALGAEYALDMGVFFQARYNLGFTDVYDEVDGKNSVIQLGVGYKF